MYFGFTGIMRTKDEAYRWLSTRGHPNGGRNRPVLVHGSRQLAGSDRAEGNVVTCAEATKLCGFEFVEIYHSPLRHNALLVEALLQIRYQEQPLGVHRCWRAVAKGSKQGSAVGSFRVFMTYSREVPQLVCDGFLKVQR